MTDPARLRRRRTATYVATTLAASATGAAGVGWAAATPVAQSSAAPQPAAAQTAHGRAVAHQLRAARAALERVRHDVTKLSHAASNLPSPHVGDAGSAVSSGSGSGYVPPPAPVVQPAAPPPANTTTGASGVTH